MDKLRNKMNTVEHRNGIVFFPLKKAYETAEPADSFMPSSENIQKAGVKPWTILVYSSGTADIDKECVESAKDLERAGSDENLNLALQMSRRTEASWNGARRYYLTESSSDSEPANLSSRPLEDLGSIDMSAPTNLENFIKWGVGKFPALHTMLVIGGHGAGFVGAVTDGEKSRMMPLPEMSGVLEKVRKETGFRPDVVVFNACMMAQAETFVQMGGSAGFVIACETDEKGAGMPLGNFVSDLKEKIGAGESVSAGEASEMLLSACEDKPELVPVVSVFDGEKTESMLKAIDQLALSLLNPSVDVSVIRDIIRETPGVLPSDQESPPFGDYRDLRGFCRRLADSPAIQDENVRAGAKNLMNLLSESVKVTNGGNRELSGLSIYLPAEDPGQYGDFMADMIMAPHGRLEISSKTRWPLFLRRIFSRDPVK